jgi:hypothetical protein
VSFSRSLVGPPMVRGVCVRVVCACAGFCCCFLNVDRGFVAVFQRLSMSPWCLSNVDRVSVLLLFAPPPTSQPVFLASGLRCLSSIDRHGPHGLRQNCG